MPSHRAHAIGAFALVALLAAPLVPAHPPGDLLQEDVLFVTLFPSGTALEPGALLRVKLLDGLTLRTERFPCVNYGFAVFDADSLPRTNPLDPFPVHHLDHALWQEHRVGENLSSTAWTGTVVFPGAPSGADGRPGYVWAYYENCEDPVQGGSGLHSSVRNDLALRGTPGLGAMAYAPTAVFVGVGGAVAT